jgi:hypothetical protein
MSRIKSLLRKVAMTGWRLLKTYKIIPAHIIAEDVMSIGRSRFSRAVLAPDVTTVEVDYPESQVRLRKLLSKLSSSEQESARFLRTLIRQSRYDVYDRIYDDLQVFTEQVPANTKLSNLLRERLSIIILKTCMRYENDDLAIQLLTHISQGHKDWLQSKFLVLRASKPELDETEFIKTCLDGHSAGHTILLERRAGFLFTQGRAAEAKQALTSVDETHSADIEMQFLRHNLAVSEGSFTSGESPALKRLFHYFNLASFSFDAASSDLSVNSIKFHDVEPVQGDRVVTVIFPIKNCADTIRAALRSAYLQSYKNIEVIVVDDASTDNTVEVVKATFAEFPHVTSHLYENPISVGPFVSRNIGIKMAHGDFITFNDGDDVSHPQRFAIHVGRMSERDITMYETSRAVRMTRSGIFEFQPWHPNFYLHVAGATLFARREVFDIAGLFDSVRYDGDFEFSRRLDRLVGSRGGRSLRQPLYIADLGTASLTTAGHGTLDVMRRNENRLKYHTVLLDHYDKLTDPSRLVLDGVVRLNHTDYSALPMHVSADDIRQTMQQTLLNQFDLR